MSQPFPHVPVAVTVEAAFGADRTADPGTWSWTDITSRWVANQGIKFTPAGRSEGSTQTEAGSLGLVVRNNDGAMTPDDARSQYWPNVDEGLPLRVTLDPGGSLDPLVAWGYVAKLDPDWPDDSERYAVVNLDAGGIIRYLSRNSPAIRSAYYEYVIRQNPVAFWPLTDGEGAQYATPAVGPWVMQVERNSPAPLWGRGELAEWLEPVAQFQNFTLLEAYISMGTGLSEWAVDILYRLPLDSTGFVSIDLFSKEIFTDKKNLVWNITIDGPTKQITTFAVAYQPPVFLSSEFTTTHQDLFDGNLHHMRLWARQVSGNLVWGLYIDGVQVLDDTISTTPLLNIESIKVFAGDNTTTNFVMPVGYPVVYSTVPSITDTVAAVRGNTGQTAAERFLDLCTQNNIPAEILGDDTYSEVMGPRRPGKLVEALRECETAEDGVIIEAGGGLILRTREARYNQASVLTIDASARQLGKGIKPVRDDQRIRNQWTAKRVGGGSVTVNEVPDQQRRGVRQGSTDLNIASDARLADHANWHLKRALDPSMRHSNISLNLESTPTLVAPALATLQGDRIVVTGMPSQYPLGGLDQILEKTSHTLTGTRKWRWEAAISPYKPWIVGVYGPNTGGVDPDAPSRYESGGCVTDADFDAGTDTALVVETTSGPVWTQASGALPMDINVAGVRLRVTNISAPTGAAQTMTVTATPVNGITKTIPAGEPVSLWQPARYAL